jgi:hypothetical protein
MRRRRFAGEQLGSLQGFSSDTLAAATEALKQAQAGLKSDTGDRLGPGTQKERDEAAAQAAATPSKTTTTTAAPATLGNLSAADVSRLRSALGIDELTTALRMGAAGLGGSESLPQFEMPKFEMPKFEMPKFELPDISSMFPTQQTGAPANTATVETPQPTTASTRVQVGGRTFNLAKVGGAGLGVGDVRAMQNRGWTTGQIRKAATQAPRVSSGAQKILSAPKATAKTQARTITSNVNKAVSKKK